MNILVIGCDQVGAALVRDLERIGHDISLIEKDPEQLKRLSFCSELSRLQTSYKMHGWLPNCTRNCFM